MLSSQAAHSSARCTPRCRRRADTEAAGAVIGRANSHGRRVRTAGRFSASCRMRELITLGRSITFDGSPLDRAGASRSRSIRPAQPGQRRGARLRWRSSWIADRCEGKAA